MRVLIAEDDGDIRALIEVALLDHDLIPVEGGVGAMAVLADEGFDAAVLDVMMPDVDGLAVCRAIRNDDRRRDIPVVLLTALVREDDHIKGYEAGADRYLTKPFRPDQLIAVLDDLEAKSPEVRARERQDQLHQAKLLRQLENRF